MEQFRKWLEQTTFDRESEHGEWEDILLARLCELGDNEFADMAEKVRDHIGFWYA